ncbi:MAG: glycosyl transferase [Epsilonproteobacteria bacterium]|nr:glycosyl transferase [Campylobacterota bacterium]NPA56595.1 glycosyl transferase [Campylobacterota bacterium]
MELFRRLTPLILIGADSITVSLSITLAYLSREWVIGPNDIPLSHYLTFVLFYIPVALFAYSGLYRYRYDFWHETRIVAKSLLFSLLILLSFLALTRTIEEYSRYVIIVAFLLMSLLIPLEKRVVKWLLFRFGIWRKEAKFIGENSHIAQLLFNNSYLGYTPAVGGKYTTLFLSAPKLQGEGVEEILKREILNHHEILFIPTIQDFNLADSVIFEMIESRSNLILLKNRLASKYNLYLKSASDKVLGITITLLLSPLIILIALLIYLDDPRAPILYRQKRIGKGGQRFTFYKFRTMYPDARQRLRRYLKEHPEAQEEYLRYRKLKEDPRITSIGHLLRRYSLDELPQLINVLKGDMSLVGPRPYMPSELKELKGYAPIILSVKPGITGLWQVSGRNNLTFQERIHIDLWYVYNWSLWKDLVILIKTVRATLSKEGAY